MGQELKYGQMVPSMRENGETIKQMERVNFGMLMEMYTKVNGKMIKLTGMGSTSM